MVISIENRNALVCYNLLEAIVLSTLLVFGLYFLLFEATSTFPDPSLLIFEKSWLHAKMFPIAIIKIFTSIWLIPVLIFLIAFGFVLKFVFNRFWPKSEHATKHIVPQKRSIHLKDGKYEYEGQIVSNYLSSTYFTGSYFKVAILSLFHGAITYLSQKIQIWCLVISFTQLYFFKTGKSFWPLIIFTCVIALQHMFAELRKWSNDYRINSKQVNLVGGGKISRGSIKPGDLIELRNGEESPCDLIFLGYHGGKSRVSVFMNEAQVTGENAPVRKFCSVKDLVCKSVEIHDLRFHRVHIDVGREKPIEVSDSGILFGNSFCEMDPELVLIGMAGWVSTETKALGRPTLEEGHHQPSPFTDYTIKGFIITLFLMLGLSTLNTIIAIQNGTANWIICWINNVMYLNMMVPQAMEQTRMAVCAVYALQYPEGVFVNNSMISDVLGSISKVCTDKTGSITENRMEPVLTMMFKKDEHVIVRLEEDAEYSVDHLLAIMSTTGHQPEENAIRRLIKNAKLLKFDPPEPNEADHGEIVFSVGETKYRLEILINFGIVFQHLGKAVLYEYNGKYFVSVQAGGPEFWSDSYWKSKNMNLPSPFHTVDNERILRQWDEESKRFDPYSGSPRIWGHGICSVSKEVAMELVKRWHEALLIDSNDELLDSIFLSAISGEMKLMSQTLMIDTYRPGVLDGIKTLFSNGKQVSICTGDSEGAAITIAKQLMFPPTQIIMKETEDDLQKQIKEIARKSKSLTLLFNQQTMKTLEIHEKKHGFQTELFKSLISLLEEREGNNFLHRPIFYRATPSLKPFVVKLLQQKDSTSIYDWISFKRNYVLAIGDGMNDLAMFSQADISLGIESGETKDVVSKSSLYLIKEWKHTVPLLLKEGPERASMISLMVKLVFLKHWVTAFTLFFDLVFRGFPLIPMDPINPLLMLIWNAVIFTQIISHTAVDSPASDATTKKDSMTLFSFSRWAISGVLTALCIDWTVRFMFSSAEPRDYGAMILVAKGTSMIFYLYLITKEWSKIIVNERKTYNSLFLPLLLAGMIIMLLLTAIFSKNVMTTTFIVVLSYFVVKYTQISFTSPVGMDIITQGYQELFGSGDLFLPRFLHWLHTFGGRLVPLFLLILIIKISSGVSFWILAFVAILSIFWTWLIFFTFTSRSGIIARLKC